MSAATTCGRERAVGAERLDELARRRRASAPRSASSCEPASPSIDGRRARSRAVLRAARPVDERALGELRARAARANVRRSAAGGVERARELARRGARRATSAAREAVDRAADRRRRRVDLVRDAGDEQAEAGHALRQDQLRLRLAQIGERLAELGVDRGELGGAQPDLLLELLARAADLLVELRVLDGGARLIGERREEVQVGVGELARVLGAARPRARRRSRVLALERQRDERARHAGRARRLAELVIVDRADEPHALARARARDRRPRAGPRPPRALRRSRARSTRSGRRARAADARSCGCAPPSTSHSAASCTSNVRATASTILRDT